MQVTVPPATGAKKLFLLPVNQLRHLMRIKR
jgi:hypothetical protein